MSRIIWPLAVVLLALTPLLVDKAVADRGKDYRELVRKYEYLCIDQPCDVDLNRNGTRGLLKIDRGTPPAAGYDSWLVVVEEGRELLRLPHWYMDGSYRTHVALHNEFNETRLLVFDGRHAPPGTSKPPTRLVFAWDGQQMINVPPLDVDQQILSALAARDDSGTFNEWIMYEFLRLPVLICYYLLLASIIAWQVLRHKRGLRKLIKTLP